MLLKPAACHAVRRSHLLQDGKAVRIGKCPADGAKLRVGQLRVRIGTLRSHTEEMSFPQKRCGAGSDRRL